MRRYPKRHLWLPLVLCAGGLALGSRPGAALPITFTGQGVHLAEVLAHLEKTTGYEFLPQGLGTPIETARRDLDLKDLSLAQALQAISRAYTVDFFSVDSTGFRVIPLKPDEDREAPLGPFKAHLTAPALTGESGTLTMLLRITAPEEKRVESISHLGPDFRVLDNFGRPLTEPPIQRSLTGTRSQLLEYRQRLVLTLPDQRAVRIRGLRGTLVCFRKVTPLQVEFPLDESPLPRTIKQGGAEFELSSLSRSSRNVVVTTRLLAPKGLDIVGQGISREVRPYLVDDQGRVFRHFTSRIEVSTEGDRTVREQSSRFERVSDRPLRLLFEVWAREDPSEVVPLRLPGVPLPGQETPGSRAEQRPFFQKNGGILTLQVLDAAGKPFEGEVTLGVARKAGGTAVRWVEAVTDASGKLRLENFAPGQYRVTRLFRPTPGAKALTDRLGPQDVTVTAGKETALPALRVPLSAPDQ